MHVLDRTKSGALAREIIFKHTGSYLIGRLYRNRSGHIKFTNRDQAGVIVYECMNSQGLVSKLEIPEKFHDQLGMVNLAFVTDRAWCERRIT